jgi:predicted RNA-binding Zn-ribbon protein involved in translation (DUF1610 family)
MNPLECLRAWWDDLTPSPDDTVGYCPECGAEIQRRDSCTVTRRVNITPGPPLTSGYRCPNTVLGRNAFDKIGAPAGGYCEPSYKERSEWVYRSLDSDPS